MITTRILDVPESAHGRAAQLTLHIAGKGPLALLLHAFPLDHRMWLDTLHGPLGAHRTLVAVDLRGHGDSPWAGDPVHTMALLAHDAAAVVRSLADGAVDVVGLSMGGYAAFALHEEAPELVRSLALCNTRAVADSEQARAGRDAAIATVLDQGRAAFGHGMRGKLLAPGADAMLRARVATMIESQPVESIVADLRGLKVRPDRLPTLGRIAVPTLVLTGALDPIATPEESAAMAKAIPGARSVVVPDCAHLTSMEQPAAFAAALAELWQ
jgi:pimeloyl-ACP methyl ester carboxylesterase